MISVPNTYSEWSQILSLLMEKDDDQGVLSAMKQGTLSWQSGVSERFAKKLIDVINYRMDTASDKFQKDFANARGQEGAIVQALLKLRKELVFLSECLDLPVIPEKDRGQYLELVRAQADSFQNSLEESAKKDRSGKMASIVRNHKVNAF